MYWKKYPHTYTQLLKYSRLGNTHLTKCTILTKNSSAIQNGIPTNSGISSIVRGQCVYMASTPYPTKTTPNTFKPRWQQNKQQPRGQDNQFKNCFDHNQGGCNQPSCSLPHVCGRCGSFNNWGMAVHLACNYPCSLISPRKLQSCLLGLVNC